MVLHLFDLEGEIGMIKVFVVGGEVFDLSSLGFPHKTSEVCSDVNDDGARGSEGIGEAFNELGGICGPIAGYGTNLHVAGGEVVGDYQPNLGLAPVTLGEGGDGEGAGQVEGDVAHQRGGRFLIELQHPFNGEG